MRHRQFVEPAEREFRRETTSRHAEQFTPAVISVMSTPRWFTGSDARRHIVYEVHLTNGSPSR
ncbi:hypothetical protein GS4_26_01600 [Gordonia soli NBRC 108243]|uniref:Uncharacterized protein n=1 Tax=Gordonia soli NBRC 108243 TaxID=1223545 RepID=M0QQI7_9ACTN|nr:hypothetical protein GS4_26_01600 [Gordonia soli NBRC 108243]